VPRRTIKALAQSHPPSDIRSFLIDLFNYLSPFLFCNLLESIERMKKEISPRDDKKQKRPMGMEPLFIASKVTQVERPPKAMNVTKGAISREYRFPFSCFISLPPKLSKNIIDYVSRFVNRFDSYFNNLYEIFINPNYARAGV